MKKNKSVNKLKVCRKCRVPVHENSLHDYCPSCFKIVEDIFDKIREYLAEFPGATSYEMEQRLGIPLHVINNFVKDGRLIEINNDFINLQCMRCNCLLLSAHHKYCPTCEGEMMNDLLKVKEDLEKININKDDGGKMRFRAYWEK
ncbi:hypothetical protein [Alkaliphilus transvaalensis]|uniref:hypothetical protein n=1 Tax=Alkaliphilus transvaalensis TaxID=114628 RepID=UPI00047E69EE|nr:hypothetical protein [Alkaliphilus transvaalensis]